MFLGIWIAIEISKHFCLSDILSTFLSLSLCGLRQKVAKSASSLILYAGNIDK